MTFDYADESDPGPYPFPMDAKVEGGAGSGGDMHVLVVAAWATCSLYETWSSKYVGPGWSCGSGAKFDLSSNALRADGWTSADAAGLPDLPGPREGLGGAGGRGQPRHPLHDEQHRSRPTYTPRRTPPARPTRRLPPMGLRLRLKASFDTSSLHRRDARSSSSAMQQYGIILADNGSDWYISGDSDDAWNPADGRRS